MTYDRGDGHYNRNSGRKIGVIGIILLPLKIAGHTHLDDSVYFPRKAHVRVNCQIEGEGGGVIVFKGT